MKGLMTCRNEGSLAVGSVAGMPACAPTKSVLTGGVVGGGATGSGSRLDGTTSGSAPRLITGAYNPMEIPVGGASRLPALSAERTRNCGVAPVAAR